MPSLAERAAEIRKRQKKVGKRASAEEVRIREARTKAQEQARAANLEAFNQFEQGLGLKKSLEALAETEGLASPKIHKLIAEPVAEKVKLRLKWQGEPERVYQENVVTNRPEGFLSISITRYADGIVVVEGEKEVDRFHESNLGEETARASFENAVAQAYLKPRWNEEYLQVMQASEEPVHDLEAWPPELRD
jgi:hypothetical protein